MRTPHRYAIYFAPAPGSAWWEAGSRWLGRCAATGATFEPPSLAGIERGTFERLTADPRRYGWHATLKAPFRLADGCDAAELRLALRQLCGELDAFEMAPLRVRWLDNFLALTPDGDTSGIDTVASTCVTRLHHLAAPLSSVDIERRRQNPLTPEEDELLLRWGYPYVLQRFRFHCSLTGSLHRVAPAIREAIRLAAQNWFDPLPRLRFDSVALFAEPAKGADFVLLEHIGLRT